MVISSHAEVPDGVRERERQGEDKRSTRRANDRMSEKSKEGM